MTTEELHAALAAGFAESAAGKAESADWFLSLADARGINAALSLPDQPAYDWSSVLDED